MVQEDNYNGLPHFHKMILSLQIFQSWIKTLIKMINKKRKSLR